MGNFIRFDSPKINSQSTNQNRHSREPKRSINNNEQTRSNIPNYPPPAYAENPNPNFSNSHEILNVLEKSDIHVQNSNSQPICQQSMNNEPSAPPSYEIITDQDIQQISSQNLHAQNPTISRITIKTNSHQHQKRRSQMREYNESEYSDDPSDYESDHNKRKMYAGYYNSRDYYDEDYDYIYYKTRDGYRYKQYR